MMSYSSVAFQAVLFVLCLAHVILGAELRVKPADWDDEQDGKWFLYASKSVDISFFRNT